jgi:hypothetical protein
MSELQTEQPTSVFVIRLWQEWSFTVPHWRGRVVHLQSGKTAAFQDWEQLTAFLQEWSQGNRK